MAKLKFDLDLIDIVPLNEELIGAFVLTDKDEEFQHLADWLTDMAINSQKEKKSKTYLAIFEKQVVGFICVSMSSVEVFPGMENNTDFSHQMMLIGKLYTVPQYRSQGIGRILMEFAIDIARKIDELTGCVGIILDANKCPRTIKFYKSFGLAEIGTKGDHIKMALKIPEVVKLNDEIIVASES